MKPNVLPIAFSNSGVRLEEVLNLLDTEPPQEKVYGLICLMYRRLAAGALLMDGDPTRLLRVPLQERPRVHPLSRNRPAA